MKIARFQSNGHVAHGVVEGDEVIEIEGDIFSEFKADGERRKLADVKLLAPTDPREIWAPGAEFRQPPRVRRRCSRRRGPSHSGTPGTVDQGPRLAHWYRGENHPAP